MNIFCLDTPVATALRSMGHNVWAVCVPPGVVDIVRVLATRHFKPDVLIQTEVLHDRTFLRNLDQLDCLKVFWAFDSHLNIHWHKYYARLFDVVLTPHLSLFQSMPKTWTPPRLHRLARPGYDLPYRPHAERKRPMTFVGLDLADTRPLRRRFLDLLQPLGLIQVSGLDTREMLEMYLDTRVVPNESIGFEVNFRLTEAASAGACVLSPHIGEDQDSLFVPNREIVIYEHGLDLLEKAAWLRDNPDQAEKTGLAAWLRTRESHLPVHRARALLALLEGVESARSNPADLLLTLAQRGRHMRQEPPRHLVDSLEDPGYPDAMAMHLRCLCEFYPGDEAEYKILSCLQAPALSNKREILLVCLGYALRTKKLELFQTFWGLWHGRWPHPRPEPPASLYQAALMLAGLFQRLERNFQPGFSFDPLFMLPESALEALQLAREFAQGDMKWARRMALLCGKNKVLTQVRQNMLKSALSAFPSWRLREDYGVTSLQAYDNRIALAELGQAAREADEAGKFPLFRRILESRRISPDLLG